MRGGGGGGGGEGWERSNEYGMLRVMVLYRFRTCTEPKDGNKT